MNKKQFDNMKQTKTNILLYFDIFFGGSKIKKSFMKKTKLETEETHQRTKTF